MEKLVFKPVKEATRLIENYLDCLCENLFINDTYYGILLVSLNTLNEGLIAVGQNSEICLTYNTDHNNLRFTIEGVENQIYTDFKKHNDLKDTNITLELLNQLCDYVLIENAKIVLEFNIGALHNSIYRRREILLKAYFNKQKVNLLDI